MLSIGGRLHQPFSLFPFPFLPLSFSDLIDLAAERFGGAVIAANDEFFAPKESLLKASKPEWREGVYTERG